MIVIALVAFVNNIIALLETNSTLLIQGTNTIVEAIAMLGISPFQYTILQIVLLFDVICFTIIIFSPQRWWFFTLTHVVQAILVISDASVSGETGVIGTLMIVIGLIVAFANGYFNTKPRIKIFLFTLLDRKSKRLNSSHIQKARLPSSY